MKQRGSAERIDEELVSVNSFVDHVKRACPGIAVSFEREESDPPDFWVTVQGERYAAEVTSIVTGQCLHELSKYFVKDVDRCVRRAAPPSGVYAVVFRGQPELPSRDSKKWNSLVEQGCQFISQGAALPQDATAVLLKDLTSRNQMRIEKCLMSGSSIRWWPLNTKWEGQVSDELTDLLGARLREKRSKLQKKKLFDKYGGVILLLYDAYNWAENEQVCECFSKMEPDVLACYHSVFWVASFPGDPHPQGGVLPSRTGFSLHTKQDEWCQVDPTEG